MTALGVGLSDDRSARFRLFSAHASAIELCLFPRAGGERRASLERGEDSVWQVVLPDVAAGDRYGYRVHGQYDPSRGHRFCPAKLLIDPYAKLIVGRVDYGGPVFGYEGHDPARASERDSAHHVPRGVVTPPTRFDWQGTRPPRTPWRDTVIYEAHLKGLTKLMPEVPAERRGTYLGLASEPAIAHLRALGVTAVELLPIHECVDEPKVAARGQVNYWGYSPLGYFAPSSRYACDPENAIDEFRTMVRALHRAGIEVLLDVVYNHTCEGDVLGPTLSFRGIDNAAYYELDPHDPARYVDRAACGNTLRIEHPAVLRMVMDSLRYWVTEMGVDGFRFDLASVLGREHGRFDRGAAFFDVIHQDPVLTEVKLIAEPWDATAEGYALGAFPRGFREWNGRYRDDVRRFWNGYERRLGPLGYRLTGSSDVFGGRGPTDSINFVTAHDGFTLRDLVSYEERHNERNGEANRDGSAENYSASFGVEGPTDEPTVVEARARQMRALMTTLLLTPGVPMLLAGDEMGRTQRGNNNAYCLDDATSWIAWVLDGPGRDMLAFTRNLSALRRSLPALRPVKHYEGTAIEDETPDLRWLRPDGLAMTGRDWDAPPERGLTMLVREDEGATLAILVNGAAWPLDFVLPPCAGATALVNSAYAAVPPPQGREGLAAGGRVYHLEPRAIALLRIQELP
jgi:isoamylase